MNCIELTLIYFSFLTASCVANDTAMQRCGEANTCKGSASSYVCICDGKGWKLNPVDAQECLEGIFMVCLYKKKFISTANVQTALRQIF